MVRNGQVQGHDSGTRRSYSIFYLDGLRSLATHPLLGGAFKKGGHIKQKLFF